MPSPAKTSKNLSFTIEDNGDSFDLALFDGDVQVAGAFFPDDGSGKAFELAHKIGRFYGNPINAIDRYQ
jgi:hypothetical protein